MERTRRRNNILHHTKARKPVSTQKATRGQVLLIDDEEEILSSYGQTLELYGYDVATFQNADDALLRIDSACPGVVLTDVRMPGTDGLELLERITGIDDELPVIIITAHGDVQVAVSAMQRGAYDFIEKPVDPQLLMETVRRAFEKRNLVLENRRLTQALAGNAEIEQQIIGRSGVIRDLRETINKLAGLDVDILLTGETGVGKELVARCLHDLGNRHAHRFIAINCGGLPDSIIESELFGHEKGAFTSAHRQRIGKIEYADGGTLFLDEIESMPLLVQARLLRVLQERCIERVGGNEPINVDIRVIAAAKADLGALSNQGGFRDDLYYRLNVANLRIPALRERSQDIAVLFERFARLAALRHKLKPLNVTPVMHAALLEYAWPGNVRELKNAAERFAIGLPTDPLRVTDANDKDPNTMPLAEQVERFEKGQIARALDRHQGRIEPTAAALAIPRKTLYLRMKKYGLSRDQFRTE